MKTKEQVEEWVTNSVQNFETAFEKGSYGQAAMAAERIYTVLNFIGMKQELEQIMDELGWERIKKAFSEARVNVKQGTDYQKAV